MIIKIIVSFFMLLSILCTFDARPIARRFFTTADRNIATNIIKIVGIISFIVLAIIFSFVK